MKNRQKPKMSLEQFLRGSLNVTSERTPRNLIEAVENSNLPFEIELFHDGTLKSRIDSLDSYGERIMSGSSDESFSIPITEEQEEQIENLIRQFYEARGYNFSKKETSGLSNTYIFQKEDSKEAMVVTCTFPMYNDEEPLLVSASKINLGERKQ